MRHHQCFFAALLSCRICGELRFSRLKYCFHALSRQICLFKFIASIMLLPSPDDACQYLSIVRDPIRRIMRRPLHDTAPI
jgi:hypothetical protein